MTGLLRLEWASFFLPGSQDSCYGSGECKTPIHHLTKHQERGGWEGRTPTLIVQNVVWQASLNVD